MTVNQGIAECILCIHCFPYPLCMQASPNVLPSISLFSSSFLLIHISDFITSSLHPSQQDPWSLECLYYIMKQLQLVGRGGSEGAVQSPGMMESAQQYISDCTSSLEPMHAPRLSCPFWSPPSPHTLHQTNIVATVSQEHFNLFYAIQYYHNKMYICIMMS